VLNYNEIDIQQILERHKGQEICYCPNPGNAGDALIAHSTYNLFLNYKIRCSIIGLTDIVKGKSVFYGGGGNLRVTRSMGHRPLSALKLLLEGKIKSSIRVLVKRKASIRFLRNNIKQNKEIIILPYTINAFEGFFRTVPPNMRIMCREKLSYQFVHNIIPNKKNVYLSKDLAFYLDLRSLQQKGSGTLNCFRTDKAEKTNIRLPKDNIDLSRHFGSGKWNNESMTSRISYLFIKHINQYEHINTNRLHVAIAGGLLGKKVNLYANAYYKNQAVYEYSMRKMGNVKFINQTEGTLKAL